MKKEEVSGPVEAGGDQSLRTARCRAAEGLLRGEVEASALGRREDGGGAATRRASARQKAAGRGAVRCRTRIDPSGEIGKD